MLNTKPLMRQSSRRTIDTPAGLLWASLLACLLLLLLTACSRPVLASVDMMNQAEAKWQADPVSSYHIVVDVERADPLSSSEPGERRRNALIVRQGDIADATVRYWDSKQERWEEPYDLNPEQAAPFTVPGLFEMVRGAIRDSGRVDVRVVMQGEPAFPYRIVMGPVWQDNQPVPGTEAEVIVREFEVLE